MGVGEANNSNERKMLNVFKIGLDRTSTRYKYVGGDNKDGFNTWFYENIGGFFYIWLVIYSCY